MESYTVHPYDPCRRLIIIEDRYTTLVVLHDAHSF